MTRKLIYDVGMNNGDDTAYYLREGYRVVAVEASPTLVEQAERRFEREIGEGLLTLLNVGISEAEGQLPFWICDSHSEWSSFDRGVASRDGSAHHQITVPGRRLRSLFNEFGVPYYLKVDIEGNDEICLRDLVPGHVPQYVSTEAGGTEILRWLAGRGYRRFKCISQLHFLPLEFPPSREQRRFDALQPLIYSRSVVPRIVRVLGAREWLNRQSGRTRTLRGWKFSFGSSGPFGDDLMGRWQSCEEMYETYETALRMRSAGQPSSFWGNKEYSFWADFHARLDG